jgi:hypothetical protein
VVRSYFESKRGVPVLEFIVDGKYPGRWREPPYYEAIKRAAAIGLAEKFAVKVICGTDVFFVFPMREIHRKIGTQSEEEVARNAVEFDAAIEEFELLRRGVS